jgi:uncharacterized repeat protein (TIGR01451 family)
MKKYYAIVSCIVLVTLLANGFLLADLAAGSSARLAGEEESSLAGIQDATPWYDPAWNYRRPVTITNNGTAQTNYQVLVKLDASFDFSHARPDGGDLRVTAADGTTGLSYWIEDWLPALNKAWIWVKVPTLDVGTTTLYLYYGNAAAASTANGRSTFIAYDGFEDYAVGAIPTGYSGNPGQWTRYPGNPVLTVGAAGQWDASGSTFASVIYDETAGEYRMYYHGFGTVSPCTGSCVGLATSPDGLTWTRYASNPVMTPTPSTWDAGGVRVPMVWKEGPNDYRMIYTGRATGGAMQIGYATSTNGINWTKSASNPVFNDPTWANNSTENWGVIKVGSQYLMWYSDLIAPRESGIAVSTNLTSWTPYQSTPIFATSGVPSDYRYSQFCPFTFYYGGYFYVLMPSYTSVSDYSRYYLYRSSSPYFPESDRTLVRIAHGTSPSGWDSVDNDTPMVLTDDIERTILHNNQLWTYYASIGAGNKWQEGLLIETNIGAALAPADLPGTGLAWTVTATAPSYVQVTDTPVHQGVRSINQYDSSTTAATQLRGTFANVVQGSVGAWMRRASTSAGDTDLYLYSSVLSAVAGLGRNGKFHYWDGTFHDTTVSWQVNTWYLVTLTFNTDTDTYSLVVFDGNLNEIVRVNNIAFGNTGSDIYAAVLYTDSPFNGNAYADDFRVQAAMETEPVVQVGAEQGKVDLGITKTDTPDPAYLGNPLTYQLTIANNSIIPAPAVLVTDTLPAQVQVNSVTPSQGSCTSESVVVCSLGSIPANSSATVTIQVTPLSTGSIINQAVTSSPSYDTNSANNSSQATTLVNPRAELSVTKTDSPDPVYIQDPLVYTVTVQNSGPSPATGVALTDTLPASMTILNVTPDQGTCGQVNPVVCSLGSVATGASVEVVIEVIPNQSGLFTNNVSVASGVFENNYANNNFALQTNVLPKANLGLTLTDQPDPVVAGEALTYTMMVNNAGPSTATGVTLVNTLPAWVTYISSTPPCNHSGGTVTCNLGNVSNGASIQVTLVGQVSPAASGTLLDTAYVTSSVYDPDLNDNNRSTTTAVTARADVVVSKTDNPDPAGEGDPLTYTLSVQNLGPSVAQNVTLTDTLPANVTLFSVDPGPGSCNFANPVICNLGTLTSGGSAQVVLGVIPTARMD